MMRTASAVEEEVERKGQQQREMEANPTSCTIDIIHQEIQDTRNFILEWTTCLYTSFYGFICVYVRDCVQVIPAYPPGGDTSAGSFGNGHATSVT